MRRGRIYKQKGFSRVRTPRYGDKNVAAACANLGQRSGKRSRPVLAERRGFALFLLRHFLQLRTYLLEAKKQTGCP
jgi:hypothetical protein